MKIALMHEKLEEDLGIPMMLCFADERKWTKTN